MSRTLTVIVNSQSCEAQAIKAGVLQGSLPDPTIFLLYINLYKNLSRLFVNSYADYTSVSRFASQAKEGQSLSADISSVRLSR